MEPRNALGGASGRVLVQRSTKQPKELSLADDLTDLEYPRAHRHELGHAIDQVAMEIPVKGLSKELKPLYNELNTGQRRDKHLTGPKHLGYSGDDVPREFMADAIRAYLTDPNSLKALAPKTAARIRQYVNSNPKLKNIIQFNSFGATVGLGALLNDHEWLNKE